MPAQKFLFWRKQLPEEETYLSPPVGLSFRQTKEDYYKFQKALYELSRSEWDKDLLDLFCEESLHLGDYVSSLAPEGKISVYGHAGYQNLPGADCVNKMSMRNVPGAKGGDRLFGIFDRAVKARNIPVLVNCPARRLVRRGNEVLGVEAIYEGKPYFVKSQQSRCDLYRRLPI